MLITSHSYKKGNRIFWGTFERAQHLHVSGANHYLWPRWIKRETLWNIKWHLMHLAKSQYGYKCELPNPFRSLETHPLHFSWRLNPVKKTPVHTFQFLPAFILWCSPLLKPQSELGRCTENGGDAELTSGDEAKRGKPLPLTLMSVPGSARILNTVSTRFLLHARWRRVSPLARTHNGQAHPKERRRKRREKPKIRVCLMSCPLSPSIWWTNQ